MSFIQLVPLTAEEPPASLMQALDVRQTGSNTFAIGSVLFDRQARIVTIPAKVNPDQFTIEYALVAKFGKTHESLLVTEARPQQVHLACLLLGMGPVRLAGGQNQPEAVPATNAVRIEVAWKTKGRRVTHPLEKLIAVRRQGTEKLAGTLSVGPWLYNGSDFGPDGFRAEEDGSFISLIRDPVALVNNPRTSRDNDDLHTPNKKLAPKDGTPVSVILHLPNVTNTTSLRN